MLELLAFFVANATLKPLKVGVVDRTTNSNPLDLEMSGYDALKWVFSDCALQKPGACNEGTILHVPLNTPVPWLILNVAWDRPPITGSFVSLQLRLPSKVSRVWAAALVKASASKKSCMVEAVRYVRENLYVC